MDDERLRLHEEASLEALAAHDYYAEKSLALGEAFENELSIAFGAISDNPEIWAAYVAGTRRYLMRRFPFVIVYRICEPHIDIIAVAHGSRKPGYWRDRT